MQNKSLFFKIKQNICIAKVTKICIHFNLYEVGGKESVRSYIWPQHSTRWWSRDCLTSLHTSFNAVLLSLHVITKSGVKKCSKGSTKHCTAQLTINYYQRILKRLPQISSLITTNRILFTRPNPSHVQRNNRHENVPSTRVWLPIKSTQQKVSF